MCVRVYVIDMICNKTKSKEILFKIFKILIKKKMAILLFLGQAIYRILQNHEPMNGKKLFRGNRDSSLTL